MTDLFKITKVAAVHEVTHYDPIDVLVADLRELGAQVGSDRAAQSRAYTEKVTAEGQLLAAVLAELAAPIGDGVRASAIDAILGPAGLYVVVVAGPKGSLEVHRTEVLREVLLYARPEPGHGPGALTLGAVTAEWAASHFGLQPILAGLIDLLDVHAGRGMLKSAEKMTKHAAVVRALTTVLRRGEDR